MNALTRALDAPGRLRASARADRLRPPGLARALRLDGLQWGVGRWQSTATDLDLEAGQVLALLGHNGAGKTALLDTLAGFLAPRGGRVLLGSRDLAALPPEQRGIGYMFQRDALFPHWTVERNLRFGRGAVADPAPLIDALDLHRWLHHLPGRLSGGQRQRVALARALVGSPDLLLLDEPLSAIDPEARPALRRTLADLLRRRGATAIVVTHDAGDARQLGDVVGVLDAGRLLQTGTVQAVFERPADLRTARLVGVDNLWPLRVAALRECGDGAVVDLATGDDTATVLRWQGRADPGLRLRPGGRVTVAVRAEAIEPCAADAGQVDDATNEVWTLRGALQELRCEGPLWRLRCILPCGLAADAFALPHALHRLGLRPGDPLGLRIRLRDAHLLEAE